MIDFNAINKKEFLKYICSQAISNGNAVSVDDFTRDGMTEIYYPKTFKINDDQWSWSISKRHTKGRHLCNHYELWLHGKINKKIATGELTKTKLRKLIETVREYYLNKESEELHNGAI